MPYHADPGVSFDDPAASSPCPGTVTLFGHFESTLAFAYLNGQPPDPDCERDLDEGFVMPTIKTRNYAPADVNFGWNSFAMRYIPSRIDFGKNGPCTYYAHAVPRLAADMTFTGQDLMMYWYASADGAPNSQAVDSVKTAPSIVPGVGVYARLETGLYSRARRIVAEGDTGSGFGGFDANRWSSTVTMVNLPGQTPVYEFRVPMRMEETRLSASEAEAGGLVLSVTMYQLEEEAVSFTQSGWRVRCGASFPCRLEASLLNPLQEVEAKFQSSGGRLALSWTVASPLGSYDVDPESVRLQLLGPVTVASSQLEPPRVKRSEDHDGVTKPVRIEWVQSVRNLTLPDGEYELVAGVDNSQHTFRLRSSWRFDVVEGTPTILEEKVGLEGKTYVPGPGPILVLLALAALTGSLFHRRR